MDKRTLFFDTEFETREAKEEGVYEAEGIFIVFNTPTEIIKGQYEQISPDAINLERDLAINDIAALANHNTALPLARTSNGTLQLRKDEKGVHGVIRFNPNDSEAMNWYQRIKSGTIYQNSFGFEPLAQTRSKYKDGTLTTITDLRLFEVSPVTFPAYSSTELKARSKEIETEERNKIEERREQLKNKLKEVVGK